MLNKLKMKKRLVFVLLLLVSTLFSNGQDTIVRKKYLDSVKNQLALYTLSSYTHLELYNKSIAEKNSILADHDRIKELNDQYEAKTNRRQNIDCMLVLAVVAMGAHILINHFKYHE